MPCSGHKVLVILDTVSYTHLDVYKRQASGNRCLIFLDTAKQLQTVLLLYGKGDLPKNLSETQYLFSMVKNEFGDL